MVCWWNAFMHDITDYLRSQIADLTQVVLESSHSTYLYLLDVRDTKRELALLPVLHKMAQHHRGVPTIHKLAQRNRHASQNGYMLRKACRI